MSYITKLRSERTNKNSWLTLIAFIFRPFCKKGFNYLSWEPLVSSIFTTFPSPMSSYSSPKNVIALIGPLKKNVSFSTILKVIDFMDPACKIEFSISRDKISTVDQVKDRLLTNKSGAVSVF